MKKAVLLFFVFGFAAAALLAAIAIATMVLAGCASSGGRSGVVVPVSKDGYTGKGLDDKAIGQ